VLLLASRVWGVGLRLPLVALQATRRMGLLVALEVGDLALRATLSVLAALAGWGAPGVVAGQALGGLLIALVALAVYARVTDREPRLPPLGEVVRLALRGRLPTGQLLGFGLSVVLERDLRIVANSLPALLLGYFASAAEVGRFRVALSYMSLPTLLHEPLGRVLMVSFPELRVRDARRLGAAYWLSTLVSAAAILAVSLALALLAPWLVPLVYGREYAASAGLAALLGLAAALGGLSSTNIPLLRALNRVLPAVWLGGAALLLSLPLLAWLVAHYQALGAAAAYSLGALLLSLAGQWVAWRSLGRDHELGAALRGGAARFREDGEDA
jgi:O-antigen/teichoic acid export membrane protein